MSGQDPMQVDRREFLQAGALATASTLVVAGSASSQEPKAEKGILPTRKLGKTGVDITILNVGTGAWRSLGGGADRLLRTAYSSGIRYFDTANAYRTEPDVAKFFKAMPAARKDTFVVTKDTPRTASEMIPMLDKRLETLQLDSVDMFFFHGLGDHHSVDECIAILKSPEFKETADKIRKSGKAKFFGFSVHHPQKAEMIQVAAETGVVDAIMVAYTPWAGKDHPINKALDAAHAKGIGLISMKQLAGNNKPAFLADVPNHVPSLKDKGFTPYQMLLQAIWTDERIASCCVSMRTLDQIAENTAAARRFEPLKEAELRQVHEMFLASSPTLCANCDGRCSVAAGTDAALGDLTRFLTYHEHHGQRGEARRLYGELTEAARDWKGADLAAAQAACPSHLDFSELLPRAERYLA
jgi:predicted aldo/keto reductase-like oxidoreductase